MLNLELKELSQIDPSISLKWSNFILLGLTVPSLYVYKLSRVVCIYHRHFPSQVITEPNISRYRNFNTSKLSTITLSRKYCTCITLLGEKKMMQKKELVFQSNILLYAIAIWILTSYNLLMRACCFVQS